MATRNFIPDNIAYSSRVKRVLKTNNDDVLPFILEKNIIFNNTTTGTVDTHKIAEVTGVVAVNVFAVCKDDLTGATATIRVGTELSDTALLPSVTGTTISENEIWHDATVDASVELLSVLTKKIITQDINYKIGTAALTGGSLTFYITWMPISENGRIELI